MNCAIYQPRTHLTALSVGLVLCIALSSSIVADEKKPETFEDAMHREHADDVPIASPATAGEDIKVSEREVNYWQGEAVTGFLAAPGEQTSKGGVLVIQEWWGLNDNIRAMARRFAQAGYTALAVDLYEGEVATDRDGARTLARKASGQEARLQDNLGAAHAYLSQTLGLESIGAVGWCFGGGWSLRSAISLGDSLDAAVIYYGRVTSEEASLSKITAPILGHFGSEDGGIPLESVRDFEQAMIRLDKRAAIHIYQGADHAFANPSGTRYQQEAAELAWERTLSFFAATLSN